MAEEFQAAVCGENRWSSPGATFNCSPCITNLYGGCCQNDFANMKTSSTQESSSTTTNWHQDNLFIDGNGRTGDTYNETLQEILNSSSFDMDQEQASNFITTSGDATGNLVNSYPSSLLQTLYNGSSSSSPLYDFHPNLNEFDPLSSMPLKHQISERFWNPNLGLEKPNCHNIKSRNEEIRDLGLLKKNSSESTFKRPRLETPSPLPTFKVRKEKLGDRVTALQQLVSPFGKTDTASVLHEAIEYIKLLHDQVNVLIHPYMKNGATMQVQQINDDNVEGAKQQELQSRGLCLVPVSSIFPVATDPIIGHPGLRSTFI